MSTRPEEQRPDDLRAILHTYLQETREALLWKLDGLDERDLRLPRTPTGTSLLGILKHAANVEIGYFGTTFGLPWPEVDDPCFVADDDYDADPQADWVVGSDVPAVEVVAFYRRVWAFADATITTLPLDTLGHVPWWRPGRQEVTLHRVLVHVLDDLSRHAGQADILRELADGAVGWKTRPGGSNVPDGVDWPAHVARMTAIAEEFPG